MEINDILTFDEKALKPESPRGLWFCSNVIEASNAGENAVCLGMGEGYDGLEHFSAWFARFKYLFICIRDDRARAEAETELRTRLPNMPILSVSVEAFKGHASIESFRKAFGNDYVGALLIEARELPPYGLINIADVKPLDVTRIPRALSGIAPLDRALGGFLSGDVTVWSGKRGEGKSTALNQIILSALDQGNVCAYYSGELRAERLKDWLYLQAAGPKHIVPAKDSSGHEWYKVPQSVSHDVDSWLDAKLFLYDTGIVAAHDEDRIMAIFEYAVRRYGATVFAIDNLMTTSFKRVKEADFYRAQSQFVGRCAAFAKAHNVHVHIVAHPKKVEGVTDGDDISGSSDIANRADNVVCVKRMSESDAVKHGFDTGLRIIKSRWTGSTDNIRLRYEPKSHRLYAADGGAPTWKYGWERSRQQSFEEIPDEPVPFK